MGKTLFTIGYCIECNSSYSIQIHLLEFHKLDELPCGHSRESLKAPHIFNLVEGMEIMPELIWKSVTDDPENNGVQK